MGKVVSSKRSSTREELLDGVIDDLGPRQRVERMQLIANALLEIIRKNQGEVSAKIASEQVAEILGITLDEVRYGLVFGERVGDFVTSNNGSNLKAA